MNDDEKACSIDKGCPYKHNRVTDYYNCDYEEYCDFQLPRDSRVVNKISQTQANEQK